MLRCFFCDRNEEGEEQLHLRRLQLPFNFATGEAMLYDVTPTIGSPDPCSAPKQRKLDNSGVSPNSLLGCMINQDQSLYHNNNSTVGSIDDLAFKDTHATVSVPGDAWMDNTLKHMTGSLMKSEAMVQDMMDTLQQILGENELTQALDVEPDELKSWENTLLKLSTCDMSDDLSDILSNDVLMYVEEQLQREGGLKVSDQLDDIPPCMASLHPQSENHDVPGQQNFGWTGEPQNLLLANREQPISQQGAPVCGTMKLSHIDPPQLSSAGLDGPTLQHIGFQQSSGPQDACSLDQSIAEDSNLGAFARRQPLANQGHFSQMPPPTQNHHQMRGPASVQDKNPVFNSSGNHWSANSNQLDHFVDSYGDNNPSQQGFAANPSASSCLQGHFALQSQNSDHRKPSWSLDQQQLHRHPSDGRPRVGINQMSGFPREPLRGVVTVQNAVNGGSPFKNAETSNVPYAAQQNVSGPCMFSNVAPSVPSRHVLNPSARQMGSKPSCLYRGLPGGVAIPGTANVLNPDEATLTCKTTMALGPEDLLVQQQQYLHLSDTHTQVTAGKTPIQSSSLQFSTAEHVNTGGGNRSVSSAAVNRTFWRGLAFVIRTLSIAVTSKSSMFRLFSSDFTLQMNAPCAFSGFAAQRPSSHREWRFPLLLDAQRERLPLGEQLSRGDVGTAEGCGCERIGGLKASKQEWHWARTVGGVEAGKLLSASFTFSSRSGCLIGGGRGRSIFFLSN